MKNLIQNLTAWAWIEEIHELKEKLRQTEKHRDAVLDLYNGTKPWTDQLQDENSRLRNLCFQMRMSFRRIKGRGTNCTPYNWPNTDRLPSLPNNQGQPRPSNSGNLST